VNASDDEPTPGAVYLVELCSGDRHPWRYLGPPGAENARWQDVETAREFGEASVLYAWRIIRRLD